MTKYLAWTKVTGSSLTISTLMSGSVLSTGSLRLPQAKSTSVRSSSIATVEKQ